MSSCLKIIIHYCFEILSSEFSHLICRKVELLQFPSNHGVPCSVTLFWYLNDGVGQILSEIDMLGSNLGDDGRRSTKYPEVNTLDTIRGKDQALLNLIHVTGIVL